MWIWSSSGSFFLRSDRLLFSLASVLLTGRNLQHLLTLTWSFWKQFPGSQGFLWNRKLGLLFLGCSLLFCHPQFIWSLFSHCSVCLWKCQSEVGCWNCQSNGGNFLQLRDSCGHWSAIWGWHPPNSIVCLAMLSHLSERIKMMFLLATKIISVHKLPSLTKKRQQRHVHGWAWPLPWRWGPVNASSSLKKPKMTNFVICLKWDSHWLST